MCSSCGYGNDMKIVEKLYDEIRTSKDAAAEAQAFGSLHDYIGRHGLSVEIHVVHNDGQLSDDFENIQPADVAAMQLVVSSPDTGESRTLKWKPLDPNSPFVLYRE